MVYIYLFIFGKRRDGVTTAPGIRLLLNNPHNTHTRAINSFGGACAPIQPELNVRFLSVHGRQAHNNFLASRLPPPPSLAVLLSDAIYIYGWRRIG